MNSLSLNLDLAKKTVLFALLGFVVIMLAGPIAATLAFALIGFAVWSVVQLFLQGRLAAVASLKQGFRVVGRAGRGVFRGGRAVIRNAGGLAVGTVRKTAHVGRSAVALAFEVLCGVIVGALIGAIFDGKSGFTEFAVLTGALGGAALGAVVASSRKEKILDVLPVHQPMAH
jgi:hypothetical protein